MNWAFSIISFESQDGNLLHFKFSGLHFLAAYRFSIFISSQKKNRGRKTPDYDFPHSPFYNLKYPICILTSVFTPWRLPRKHTSQHRRGISTHKTPDYRKTSFHPLSLLPLFSRINNLLHDIISSDAFRFGGETSYDTVAEDVFGDIVDLLDVGRVFPAQESERLRAEDQVL